VAHRNGLRLDSQESETAPDVEAGGPHDQLYFLVPCLNEEMVIGETVSRLLADAGATVIVIDDGSTDQTAERARRAAAECGQADRLVVHARSGADSRQGKGAALNSAFPLVVSDVEERGLDPSDVIVAVMDADGRLSAGAVNAALLRQRARWYQGHMHFHAPPTGAVAVRCGTCSPSPRICSSDSSTPAAPTRSRCATPSCSVT
jgi:cellulose synthase/poly-beta-1,6-N-acetylglucosamine synthase-like glycosyltransferase